MSAILDVRGLTKSHGARTLFEGVDLSVAEGEKVGVIGRNGTGKSTLFRILAGLEGYEEGTIALKKGARVGFLPQEPEMDPHRSVFETAGEGKAELREVASEYQRVNRELANGPEGERQETLLRRQAELSARMEALDGWKWSHRIEEVLTRLGIEGWDRAVGTLSGGERRRVALARTLLSEPDLLLLDEPTNHLDADTVLWLEERLFDFSGAVLVITHDRYFLDRVVDRMLEISPYGLAEYRGGYTEYLAERAAREERARVQEAKRTKLLEKELAWARRAPPARTGKQKARRQRARALAREQRERDRTRPGEVELEIQETPRLGRKVLEFHGVTKRFGSTTVLEGFSEHLLAGEKVGVVGPNGVGKSTLLRVAVGEEEVDEGRVVWGENTRTAYFRQDRELDPELSVARAVSENDQVEVGGRKVHLNAYLERFLFPPHIRNQKVGSLSGGERSRVLLARLFLEEANLLVLDEPTNDLDLDTLRILEETMEEFDGCILLVTHDRFLLDRLATSLLVMEGGGEIRRHHGSWDSYLAARDEARAEEDARRREQERQRRSERAAAARTQAREAREDRQQLSYREKRELEEMEERIQELEDTKEELGLRLGNPDFYQEEETDAVARAGRRFRELEGELESLYERWLELKEREG